MKITGILVAALGAAPFTSACLHAYGHLYLSGTSAYQDVQIEVVDNGAMVCKSFGPGWGYSIDNDSHVSLQCLPGYIWATDGKTAWYRNPVTAFRIDLNSRYGTSCPVGNPNCGRNRYDWDKWDFC